MTTRGLPVSTTPGAVDGDDYMDSVAAKVGRLFNASILPLTSIGGTANVVTAVVDPVLDAGVIDGMGFWYTPALTNTSTVTINIGGTGAVAIQDDGGNALAAGVMKANQRYLLIATGGALRAYGTVNIQKVNDYQVFTSSGTWTKPPGCPGNALVTVKEWGAGGGGGNGITGASSGGGGGGYKEFTYRASDLPSSVAVTIPAGGAIGNAGGTTSFGSFGSVFGGGAGNATASNNNKCAGGGGGGGPLAAGANGAAANSGNVTAASAAGGSSDLVAGNGGNGTISTANAGSATAAGTGFVGGGGGGGSADGSSSDAGTDGGASVYGGGGGAGRFGTNGGPSQFGGAGGASGAAGQAPGGGGGANASGGRGEVRVYVNG